MLHPDGRLMTENLRQARATDTYILRGDPRGETYVPRFTFHGFQFVEVSGFPGEPDREAVTGIVLQSDTPPTSSFLCSDPTVTRLFQNIVWTQRANFLELPTDCPQRDERFGWMGDAQVYARTATINADVAAFFTKWLREVEEAQLPGGAYPDYCPWPFQHGKAFAPGWTDAGIIVPWTVWQAYGDTRLLERHWPSMQRFMAWRFASARDDLGVQHPDANTWGDWLNLNENTPIEYVDTAYLAFTARLMAEMAGALGRTADAETYRAGFDRVRAAFARKYVGAEGALTVDTQTAYALALYTGLLPENQRLAAGKRLADKIRANDTRMATGFLGTRPLLPVLSAHGQHDLAVRLLQSRRFPSWGYEVENGATTIWERWDSYTREHGFNGIAGNQNASMNSFAHYSFGAVCEWMFRTLAGLDTADPGFQRLRIRPSPPTPGSNPEHPPISWVRARYDSLHGPVRTEWRVKDGRFELDLTLPPNTRGVVELPTSDPAAVRENGRPLRRSKGLRTGALTDGRLTLEVSAGTWRFSTPWR
jgi:alpha-L-rhamnosidase